MGKVIIGVVGPGRAAAEVVAAASELGRLIALEGWALLSGGRGAGVMDAASRGAKAAGGLTIGVLPAADDDGASTAVDILVITDMGQARNNINVLSSRVVVSCGMGAGTASEIALAIKAGRKVVMLEAGHEAETFFQTLGGESVVIAHSPAQAIDIVKQLLAE